MDNKIPTYKAIIEDITDGITTVSFVTNPATAVDLVCFSEQEKQELRFADDEKHCVTSVMMVADQKIYRVSGNYEYYIMFDKETLMQMAEKMLEDNTFNNISFEHDGVLIEPGKIKLVELYVTSQDKRSPFNIPEGSLVATYHILDDDLWKEFKAGRFGGISIECLCNMKNIDEKFSKKRNMLEAIKNKVKEFLLEFSNVSTDKGSIYWQGEELKEGLAVADENGEVIADGDYTLDDGRVITVKDGVISSISAPTAEEKPAEETTETAPDETKTEQTEETTTEEKQDDTEQKTEQETSTEEETTETTEETKEPQVEESAAPESQAEKPASFYEPVIDELKNSIGLIEGKLAILEETVKTINDSLQDIICKPAVPPIQEQFSNTTATLNKQTAKAADYLAYLNKQNTKNN